MLHRVLAIPCCGCCPDSTGGLNSGRIRKGTKNLTINKKATGCSNVKALVLKLRAKQPYWPVPLKEHLTASLEMGSFGAGGAASTPAKAAATPKKAAARPSSGGGGGSQDWLHPKMSNPDSSTMLEGKADGHFMIRVHNVSQRKLTAFWTISHAFSERNLYIPPPTRRVVHTVLH